MNLMTVIKTFQNETEKKDGGKMDNQLAVEQLQVV